MICHRGHWKAAAALWLGLTLGAAGSVAAADDAPGTEGTTATGAATTRPASQADEDRPVPPRNPREDREVGSSTTTLDPWSWWKTLGALALVLGIIFVLKRYLARHGIAGQRRGTGRVVEVLTKTAVSAKHQVMLMRVGTRLLVVGAGPDTLNTLAEITDPEEVGELIGAVEQGKNASITSSFSGALGDVRSQVDEEMADIDAADASAAKTPAGSAADRVRRLAGKVRDLGSSFRRQA